MRNFILCSIIVICFCANIGQFAFADIKNDFYEIKGKVVDSRNKPIPYVFVTLSNNTDIKCASGLDGTFIIRFPKATKFPITLLFTSVNYNDKSHKLTSVSKSKRTITIKLVSKTKPVDAFAKNQKEKAKKEESRLAKLKRTSSTPTTESTILGKETRGGDVEFSAIESIDRASAVALDASEIRVAEPPKASPSFVAQPNVAAGLLTAGELNDFAKWNLWEDIATQTLEEHQKVWQILPQQRYVAQLVNSNNMPIQNAKVNLKDRLGNIVWQTYTDNTGKAELWAQMLNDYLPNFGAPYSIEFDYNNQTKTIEAYPFKEKINTVKFDVRCNELAAVDIDFIIDATGSMDDEIRYLQAELYDVLAQVSKNNPHIDLRTATLFYRDWSDDYLTMKSEFSGDVNVTTDFIKEQFAAGGGDFPEAVDVALYESIENRQWRENALAKIIFLILDAPPHGDDNVIKQLHRQIRLAAMKGIRIVPLVCSGTDKSTEYLMRSIALATNGTYVFLTDESGIGGSHIKPTTDEFAVEKLNHILLRIITEYSKPANCNNSWATFDENMNSLEQYLPKPKPDAPVENTERIEISDLMNIYPTPSNGELTVDIYKNAATLYLSDVTGKVLQYFEVTGQNSFKLQLNSYANGVYFVNVLLEGRWYTQKFLLSI